jgi:predicted negative regulator of RcsB-dependent stress response
MGFLTTKIVAIIAAVLLALVGGWGVWNYLKVATAQAEAVSAKAERDEAGVARDKAIDAARVNQATIDQLKQEKASIQASLNSLEADKKRNLQVITNLSTAIRASANDPLNKVTLSPVLQATVDAIQKQRAARAGVQP